MLAVFAILTCLMIAIVLSDISRFLIPNWLVLALLVLYPVAVYLSHARPDWKTACLVCLVTFAVGNVIFILRLMGGGDIKLLTATALYAGSAAILDFVVYVAILGGLGSIVLLLMRAMTPFIFSKTGKGAESIPRVLSDGAPVPYGVAIAGAFLYMLWTNKLPGLTI